MNHTAVRKLMKKGVHEALTKKTVVGGYIVDQIYLKYNGIVSDVTRGLVIAWLNFSIIYSIIRA